MPSLKERLKEILINDGLITQEQLDEALRVQKDAGGSLQQVLIRLGYVDEQDLVSVLSQGLDIPPIRLERCRVDAEVVTLIDRDVAHHYNLMPISRLGKTLTVAMADPLNVFAIDTITRMTGFAINPIIATTQEIQQAISQYYGELTNDQLDKLVQDIRRKKDDKQQSAAQDTEDDEDDEALSLTAEAPVTKIVDLLLKNAVHMNASDILVEPMEKKLRIRYRVDGILLEVPGPPKHVQQSLVSRIKVMSALDISEHRLPQDGRCLVDVNNRKIDFRISVIPSTFGEKVALRVLDKQNVNLDVDRLGFQPEDLVCVKGMVDRPYGLVLSCGPTGSGKTTSLYALLSHIISPTKNLVTIEDPVEYQLPDVNQVTVNADIGLTFSLALRSILRQDPDVIMVGEIRDSDTADMAVKSALTGHLVLSTLHATTASGAVTRLLNMGVEPFLLGSTLSLSIGQRLVRKLCTRCRQRKSLPEGIRKKLGIEATDAMDVYESTGCSYCFQTGFRGREVIGEVMRITPEIRDAISKGQREHAIHQLAVAGGMQTMRQHAVKKLREGLTTVEEVVRTTMGER